MIIAFTSEGMTEGASFMEWSFNYLSGKEQYFKNWRSRSNIPLTDNPMNSTNAHGHTKNHPKNLKEWRDFVEKAEKQESDEPITFYPYVDGRVGINDMSARFSEGIEYLASRKVEIVHIQKTMAYPYWYERKYYPEDDIVYEDTFMLKQWLGIDELPGLAKLREMISFRILGRDKKWMEEIQTTIDKVRPHLRISISDREWYRDPPKIMRQVLESFGIKCDEERFKHWKPIADKWQGKILKLLDRYEITLPKTIKAIVDGDDMELEDMNIYQEALIMALLMRDHRCRLLTTQDHLPKNTKNLHKLIK